jgi:peptidoglycan hydrolase FlgJ
VRTYGDFAGLDSLKKAAHGNDPTAVREVARQFESLFARMIIKSMRDAIGRDPIFGSDQVEAYQSMFDDQLSLQLTRGHGLGLADMLVRQLQRRGLSGASAGGSNDAASGGSKASPAGTPGQATGTSGSSGASPSSSLAPASKAERTSFIREVWPEAQQAGAQLGVAPASLVAQAALESDWGRNVPRGASGSSHNLFGIKAAGTWSGSSASAVTQEFDGAVARVTPAQFRAYSSQAQGFQDYVALLKTEPRYAQALNTGGDTHAFASALQQAGYATDPDYARKVSAVAGSVASVLAAATPSLDEPLKFASAGPINGDTDRPL